LPSQWSDWLTRVHCVRTLCAEGLEFKSRVGQIWHSFENV